MRILFVFIISIMGIYSISAQVEKLATHQITTTFRLDLTQDRLNGLSNIKIPKDDNRILGFNAYLLNNELVIKYQLTPLSGATYYNVGLKASMDNLEIIQEEEWIFGDVGKVDNTSEKDRKIVWTNFSQALLSGKGTLEISLITEWWGTEFLAFGVDCDERPQFNLKHKLPYYGALTLGTGSLVTGVILYNKSQKHLSNHNKSTVLNDQASEYTRYEKDLEKAELFTYVGFGIIAVDAVLYFIRSERHKKRVRIFEENCNQNSLSIRPHIEFPRAEEASNIGLRLSYQF